MKLSKSGKKFKVLLIDVDGTLIKNTGTSLPSKAVVDAIAKGRDKIQIGLASSRPLYMLREILGMVNLSGPLITLGGAQIFDEQYNLVWEKAFNIKDVVELSKIAIKLKAHMLIENEKIGVGKTELDKIDKVYGIWMHGLSFNTAAEFMERASVIKDISIFKIVSWKESCIDLSICPAQATKQHAVFELAKILKIDSSEIMVVGDGYNDFPLLMGGGFRIAMGNAVDEIKAIADYIAPSVDNDGVADVIKKFIL